MKRELIVVLVLVILLLVVYIGLARCQLQLSWFWSIMTGILTTCLVVKWSLPNIEILVDFICQGEKKDGK